MSVQRYSLSNRELLVTVPDDTGALVLYDDHVAALAEERCATRVPPRTAGGDRVRAYYAERDEEVPRIMPAKPRILTADDPEPGDMAVVLGKDGSAWQRDAAMDFWYEALTASRWPWAELVAILGPLRLVHDGGQA